MKDGICIEDFCGYAEPGHFFTQFWADYFPQERVTRFGGDWREVPDLPSQRKPTVNAVHKWAKENIRREL